MTHARPSGRRQAALWERQGSRSGPAAARTLEGRWAGEGVATASTHAAPLGLDSRPPATRPRARPSTARAGGGGLARRLTAVPSSRAAQESDGAWHTGKDWHAVEVGHAAEDWDAVDDWDVLELAMARGR